MGFVVQVRYPRNHHRFQQSTIQNYGDGRPLPLHLAELIAWGLQQQGVKTTVLPAHRQLSLFGP